MPEYFTINLSNFIQAGIILVITFSIVRIISWMIDRNTAKIPEKLDKKLTTAEKTRVRMIKRLIVIGIYFIGIASALYQFPEIEKIGTAMFASAGIIGIVVGFAARTTLGSIIAGIVIAFTQPVRLGDIVEIDDIKGKVEEITLFYTVIKLKDDQHLIIPNQVLMNSKIINYSFKK